MIFLCGYTNIFIDFWYEMFLEVDNRGDQYELFVCKKSWEKRNLVNKNGYEKSVENNKRK